MKPGSRRSNAIASALFAVVLVIGSLFSAHAQSRNSSAETPSIASTLAALINLGSTTIGEASRLVESDPYWQFRNSRYSNEGLMTEREEARMGAELHLQISRRSKVVSEGQARVNRIGQRVAAASKRSGLTYRFHIIRDKEINAFSGPGGHIYVTTALMNLANDDELASVLSHEVSHIVARHSLKTIQQSSALGGIAQLFGSLTGIAGDSARDLGTAAATIVASGVLAVHNREEEREADYLGVNAMAKAGFSPQAMVTMFEKIQNVGEKDENLLGEIFADHPGIEERIENTKYEINRIRAGR